MTENDNEVDVNRDWLGEHERTSIRRWVDTALNTLRTAYPHAPEVLQQLASLKFGVPGTAAQYLVALSEAAKRRTNPQITSFLIPLPKTLRQDGDSDVTPDNIVSELSSLANDGGLREEHMLAVIWMSHVQVDWKFKQLPHQIQQRLIKAVGEDEFKDTTQGEILGAVGTLLALCHSHALPAACQTLQALARDDYLFALVAEADSNTHAAAMVLLAILLHDTPGDQRLGSDLKALSAKTTNTIHEEAKYSPAHVARSSRLVHTGREQIKHLDQTLSNSLITINYAGKLANLLNLKNNIEKIMPSNTALGSFAESILSSE